MPGFLERSCARVHANAGLMLCKGTAQAWGQQMQGHWHTEDNAGLTAVFARPLTADPGAPTPILGQHPGALAQPGRGVAAAGVTTMEM
jgi:hypothetical protein